ncbi:hypothetical protein HMPREF9946_03993 [Acetobacteraceae bacterium AT-5844]|nr:hypothetical protein HMPREF9946_03993 [Acetobacteraceae bacterium AT-5844]
MPPLDFDALTGAAVLQAFGVAGGVLFKRDGEPPLEIPGIFDRYQIEAMGEDGAPFSLKRTQLGVREADLPPGFTLRIGARVQILGKTFDVRDVQPDGLGWVVMPLGFIGDAGP